MIKNSSQRFKPIADTAAPVKKVKKIAEVGITNTMPQGIINRSAVTNNQTVPQNQTQSNGYTSPYSTDLAAALSAIKNRPAFSYNPATDTNLQNAQTETMSNVSRAAARRNMLYSDSNKAQMGQAAMSLVPQFEAIAYGKYQDQGNDLNNKLTTLMNLENQNYSRYRDNLADESAKETNKFNRDVALAELTGYYKPTYEIASDSPLRNISDYMAEIKRREATPDTRDDAEIPMLYQLRNEKIQGNPDLLAKYGNTLYKGTATLQKQQIDEAKKMQQDEIAWQRSANNPANRAQILSNQLLELELKSLPEKQRLELVQLKKQIANIGARPAKSAADIARDNYELELYKQKLSDLKANGTGNAAQAAYNAIIKDLSTMNPTEAYGELTNYSQQYIQDIGVEAFNDLLKQFKYAAQIDQ